MNKSELFDDRQGDSIFSLAVEFNLYPVKYVHSSWLKRDGHYKLVNQLRTNDATHSRLSEYLLKRFKLGDQFDFDFDAKEKRVAFASAKELLKLAFYLGIILNEDVIRGRVKRRERIALEQCLGTEAYHFAVKKAQFISHSAATNSPGLLIDWNHLDRFRRFLMTTGLRVIAVAYTGTSAAFRKRLTLKMPREYQKTLIDTQGIELNKTDCARLLIKTHKEVNRQWRHLLF